MKNLCELGELVEETFNEAKTYVSGVARKVEQEFKENVKPAMSEFMEGARDAAAVVVEDSERLYEDRVKPAWAKVKTYAGGSQEELVKQETFNSAALTGHAVKTGLLIGAGLAGHGLVLLGGLAVGADLGVRYFHHSQSKKLGAEIPVTKMPGIIGTYKRYKELYN